MFWVKVNDKVRGVLMVRSKITSILVEGTSRCVSLHGLCEIKHFMFNYYLIGTNLTCMLVSRIHVGVVKILITGAIICILPRLRITVALICILPRFLITVA